jgi:hypothetical protein
VHFLTRCIGSPIHGCNVHGCEARRDNSCADVLAMSRKPCAFFMLAMFTESGLRSPVARLHVSVSPLRPILFRRSLCPRRPRGLLRPWGGAAIDGHNS